MFLVYQQDFSLSAGLFRKIWVLPSPEFQVASDVNSELKFLDARNLTCLQPLSNRLCTNHNSLKHCSFWSVWRQKQNKPRCILGAFIVPLNYLHCALFHLKTRIGLKYFVSYCLWNFFPLNLPQTPSNLNSLTFLVALRPSTLF